MLKYLVLKGEIMEVCKKGQQEIELPIEKIIKLYNKGVSIPELAIKFFVSESTIKKRLIRENVISIKSRQTKFEDTINPQTIKELYWDKKLTTKQIAEILNTSANTVRVYMVNHNIDRRPRVMPVKKRYAATLKKGMIRIIEFTNNGKCKIILDDEMVTNEAQRSF